MWVFVESFQFSFGELQLIACPLLYLLTFKSSQLSGILVCISHREIPLKLVFLYSYRLNVQIQSGCSLSLSLSLSSKYQDNSNHHHHHLKIAYLEGTLWIIGSSPFKQAQWGIVLPTSCCSARYLKPLNYPAVLHCQHLWGWGECLVSKTEFRSFPFLLIILFDLISICTPGCISMC